MTIQVENPNGRSHRTALVVDGERYDQGGAYTERTQRLLQSLNGDNIKVDVFAFRNGVVERTPNDTVVVDKPVAFPTPTSADVKAALIEQGYEMVLESTGK